METLNQISGNLDRGISVFYQLTYLCTFSLGYVPDEKQLPQDAGELLSELHEERRLGSLWILQDAISIRDHLLPILEKVCGEFEDAHHIVETGGELTRESAKLCFQNLGEVISVFSEQSKQMKDWILRVEKLHDDVQAKEKPDVPEQKGCYSWKDAAQKLGRVLEEADEMNVSWTGMSRLAVDTVKDLEKAETNPSRIIQEVFLQAAEKQWADIVEISRNMTVIMRGK